MESFFNDGGNVKWCVAVLPSQATVGEARTWMGGRRRMNKDLDYMVKYSHLKNSKSLLHIRMSNSLLMILTIAG